MFKRNVFKHLKQDKVEYLVLPKYTLLVIALFI